MSFVKSLSILAALAASTISAEDISIKKDSGKYSAADYPYNLFQRPVTKYPSQGNSLKEWKSSSFGLFIHWGAYAALQGQWQGKNITDLGEQIQRHAKISGKDYLEHAVKIFNPVKFDAKEYVKLAKMAGMKYIILTAKHHDGFAMFDSAHSNTIKLGSVNLTSSPRCLARITADAGKLLKGKKTGPRSLGAPHLDKLEIKLIKTK